MKKMNKFAALALSIAVVSSSFALPVRAEGEIAVDNYGETTNTIVSEFTIEEEVVGMSATVVVPANLNLTYDAGTNAYMVEDYVYVSGQCRDFAELFVIAPRKVVYTNENGVNQMTGFLRMGSVSDEQCIAKYSAADLNLGFTDFTKAKGYPLILSVPASTLQAAGTYNATVEFQMNFTVMGLYNDICAAATSENCGTKVGEVQTGFGYSSQYHTLFNLPSVVASESLNIEDVNVKLGCTNPSNTERYNLLFYPNNSPSLDLKFLQMSPNAYYYTYCSNVSDTTTFNGWLKGYDNLTVLVIPKGITTAQLKCNVINDNFATNDYSGTAVGDALAFCKGVDETGYLEYVPHIVYRGTCAEWRALSGHEDWTFGDTMTAVTVHCTDGQIVYE